MTIRSTVENDGKKVNIAISEKFDFSIQREFRLAYEAKAKNVTEYVVDLSQAVYLDSAALGMLLLLRDHAGGDAARVTIRGAHGDVRRALDIANFNRLFIIT